MMQSSKTTLDLVQKDDECKQHKPVKHVRSHDIDERKHQRQEKQTQRSLFNNNRSKSSSFRHSIRTLTSCTILR